MLRNDGACYHENSPKELCSRLKRVNKDSRKVKFFVHMLALYRVSHVDEQASLANLKCQACISLPMQVYIQLLRILGTFFPCQFFTYW